jgi:hypothetical protein
MGCVDSLEEADDDRDGAPGECSMPIPARTCVAGNGGSELRVQAQGSPFHPVVTGEGKTGRVNASEPLKKPRQSCRRREN